MRSTGFSGASVPTGALGLAITRNLGILRAREAAPLWWRLKNALLNRIREVPAMAIYRLMGRIFGLVYMESCLRIEVKQANGQVIDYGVVGRRVITTVGVNFIVDAFHASATIANMKFHGFGTGTGVEGVGDTALGTEFTTEYATDNVRPTGSQTEGAANVYVTAATFSPDTGGTLAVTEHGIFDQAANSGGVLLDRTKFAAVNLTAGSDSLTATYSLTVTSGG